MGNYSKLIGSVVGAAAGALVAFGVLPEELATPEMQASVVAVLSAVFTWAFPANTPA
ncbi:MAG: hypothetical protein MEQ84_07975 [Mesorhizobium sp.]|nr:hypothetical protein [Mesorhizobium sp.]